MAGYVLSDFAKAEGQMLDDLLRGICDGAAKLAAGDGPGFTNAVALRVAPPRSSAGGTRADRAAGRPGDAADPADPAPEPSETLSPLQRLAARFK